MKISKKDKKRILRGLKGHFEGQGREAHIRKGKVCLGSEEDILQDEAVSLLKNKNLLERFMDELNKRIVGEQEARASIFIVANMRNVKNLSKGTDNLMINAFSGTGKDHITESIFEIIPNNEKEELIKTTPKVLAYTRNMEIEEEASWKKTTLRLEDASNEVLNDDSFKVISSANPNKINRAKSVQRGKIIEIGIEGKPSIIMTIASPNPKEELLRRFPICHLDEGINQTKAILKRQGEFAKKGKTIDYSRKFTIALSLLKRVSVKIPYAEKLVKIFCPENVIVRTHFPRFLDYIKSSCALHQYQRKKDRDGYFIATPQDYNIARKVLIKTTSNVLMIPLTKLRQDILKTFEKYELKNQSIEDLEDFAEIKKLNISSEWLRKQLDWLVSKSFLLKDKRRKEGIPKPLYIYSFNHIRQLNIPIWKELTESTSFTSNNKITSNSSNSSNTKGVNEVNELFEVKKSITQNLLNTFPRSENSKRMPILEINENEKVNIMQKL